MYAIGKGHIMDRREFMNMAAAVAAGLGVTGAGAVAGPVNIDFGAVASTMKVCHPAKFPAGARIRRMSWAALDPIKGPEKRVIAGEPIGAGQLVGVGSDGLGYAMFTEAMQLELAEAMRIPMEYLNNRRWLTD